MSLDLLGLCVDVEAFKIQMGAVAVYLELNPLSGRVGYPLILRLEGAGLLAHDLMGRDRRRGLLRLAGKLWPGDRGY